MKRSQLGRRTGLTSRTPLDRTGMRVARPHVTVTAAERNARKVIVRRSGGRCEGCRQARAVDWSHRVARSQGGPWCPSNGLHLCRACHDWAHARPADAYARGWRLRWGSDPATARVALPQHGWVYLNADGSLTTEKSAA